MICFPHIRISLLNIVLLIGNSFVLNIERNIEFEGTYAIDKVHKCGYFVHEYQHALRLCGLNDLADNFKVTDKTSKRI